MSPNQKKMISYSIKMDDGIDNAFFGFLFGYRGCTSHMVDDRGGYIPEIKTLFPHSKRPVHIFIISKIIIIQEANLPDTGCFGQKATTSNPRGIIFLIKLTFVLLAYSYRPG